MPEDVSPESRIVDAIETAGRPLERAELRRRVDLSLDRFDAALATLRGQEVVRKLSGSDAYRLTYWPESPTCLVCDGEVTTTDHYELTLNAQGANTEQEVTGVLHPECTRRLLDEASLSG
ncbi:MAG: hypothetical protein A07HR67_00169 [uncultured archaeon A07HR67]|nr:MAG: hypothetical protein A07HR67_00169 [uncultured archaeon A07HR67]